MDDIHRRGEYKDEKKTEKYKKDGNMNNENEAWRMKNTKTLQKKRS